MTGNASTIAVLAQARTVLLERGLFQGDYGDADMLRGTDDPDYVPGPNYTGPVCLAGAVNVATTGDAWNDGHPDGSFDALLESIRLRGHLGCDIATWNDSPGRNLVEAISLIDATIARLAATPTPEDA